MSTVDGHHVPVFSQPLAEEVLPHYKMPEKSCSPKVAFELIKAELSLDGHEIQNLATFCQTWLEPEVEELMRIGGTRNQIDKELYPQSAELEVRCVRILADLFNAPDAANATGTAATGSSEAAMLGGMALKFKWKAKREAAGKPADKPNLVLGAVQICWKKFVKYFEIEPRYAIIREGNSVVLPEDYVALCDENTIGVVPTFGVTYTCDYEDVEQLNKDLDAFQEKTGLDIPIHVDAASGGSVAPFVENQKHLVWDFRLPRVVSLNLSGHKYTLAPLGIGWTIFRDKEALPDELIFYVNYLGGNMPTFAITFSRPASQIIAQYYQFVRLGREGFRQIHETTLKTSAWLGKEIAKIDDFIMVYDGTGGLPAVSYRLKPGVTHKFDLYELSDRLATRGWKVASYPLPTTSKETYSIQRVLVRQGFSTDFAALYLKDLKDAVDFLRSRTGELRA